jgi:hypothetical protein
MKQRGQLFIENPEFTKLINDGKKWGALEDCIGHSLFSHNEDKTVFTYTYFDENAIKKDIVDHLKENPEDTIEHCLKGDIINFYEVNQKNGRISKCVLTGEKTYYKALDI